MSEVKIPSGFGLVEGEVPYWYGRMSWKANWLLLFLGLLLLLGVLIIPFIFALIFALPFIPTLIFALTHMPYGIIGIISIILLIIAALRVYSSEYFMTNKRIYVKYGIISRHVMEIKNEWITGTALTQGFIGRILNYGNVVLSTPGQYAGSVVMIGVSDPMNIRTKVEDILRRSKEREKIEEKIREVEKEHEFGRISEEKYQELKKKYEEELKKYL